MLTVIVPVYNQEKFIEQCVRSVQSQSYKDIEIILVDDGSTDNSFKICNDISVNDSKVTVIHQENKGLAGARYTGLKACKTKYVTFIDADDFILEEAYINAVEYMSENIDMIFFEIARYYDEHNIKIEKHILEPGYYDKKKIREKAFHSLIWNFEKNTPGIECSQCVKIVKTELVLKAYENPAKPDVYYGEDIVVSYQIFEMLGSMAVIDKCFYMHRQRLDSVASYIISDNFFDEIYKIYNFLICYFKNELENYNLLKQIEYFLIYSVNLKKAKYNEYLVKRDVLFPFDKVLYNKNVVLYGAGEIGKNYYYQLDKLKYCKEILWVDRNAEFMANKIICLPDKIFCFDYDYIIIALENKTIAKEIEIQLILKGADKNKIII